MQIDLSAANDEAAALVGIGAFLGQLSGQLPSGYPSGLSLVTDLVYAGLVALGVLGVTSISLSSTK